MCRTVGSGYTVECQYGSNRGITCSSCGRIVININNGSRRFSDFRDQIQQRYQLRLQSEYLATSCLADRADSRCIIVIGLACTVFSTFVAEVLRGLSE